MIVKPRIRGFVCITAHPEGCSANVQEQIDYIKGKPSIENGPKRVLVVGSSTGYGLSSRITAAFGWGAGTVGVFFERPSAKGRPASAGWYNTAAFEREASKAGLINKSINGDAFSDEIKQQTIETIKSSLGQVDLVIYSLASPRRVDPSDGAVYKSTLKPVDNSFTAKSVDTDKQAVIEVSLEPANETEIHDTKKVMGGEDWQLWIDALQQAGVLADGAKSVAYSYIGPEVTYPIYRNGTIGKAKEELEDTAKALTNDGVDSFVSVNKAVVTQASSAIPVVPLYVSILFKIMKEKGLHEGCIEQIYRLFADKFHNGEAPELDKHGRIRVDDWEMKPEIQEAVKQIWPNINTENLTELSDFATYKSEFLRLFGFGLPGVDYEKDVAVEVSIPSINSEL